MSLEDAAFPDPKGARSQTVAEPVALTIAGSDSSGGAGVQADLKTFAAHGIYGASVLTALTAQNTTGVQSVHVVPSEFVRAQIESVVTDLDVRAVKTGMLANAEIIKVVADTFAAGGLGQTVVDPVMIATSGDPLIAADAIDAMRKDLVPLADLITPNLNEAAALLDDALACSDEDMARQANGLRALGCRAVLLKGGHRSATETARDLLVDAHGAHWLSQEFIDTANTHGTGCTLAAAITANLTLGRAMRDAVGNAKAYLTRALRFGSGRALGAGKGPVDHLVDLRAAGVFGAPHTTK